MTLRETEYKKRFASISLNFLSYQYNSKVDHNGGKHIELHLESLNLLDIFSGYLDF